MTTLSPNICEKGDLGGNEINRARLPMFKQFDLKLTKSFGLGSNQLTLYADIRNLFNFENVLTVYSLTGTPENIAAFNRVTFVDDSADMAQEAAANGARPGGRHHRPDRRCLRHLDQRRCGTRGSQLLRAAAGGAALRRRGRALYPDRAAPGQPRVLRSEQRSAEFRRPAATGPIRHRVQFLTQLFKFGARGRRRN